MFLLIQHCCIFVFFSFRPNVPLVFFGEGAELMARLTTKCPLQEKCCSRRGRFNWIKKQRWRRTSLREAHLIATEQVPQTTPDTSKKGERLNVEMSVTCTKASVLTGKKWVSCALQIREEQCSYSRQISFFCVREFTSVADYSGQKPSR